MQSRLELVVDSRAAEQHLSRLDRELQRLDGRGSAATAMMGKMSLAIGAISAAAGGLGFHRIIRETASFEDAMLGLQAVSGATASQMAELEKQARTLGATSSFSAEQAGNAQRYLAMAGLEVNEVLSATPGILKLAVAGQLDLATAADIASNVLGGMNMEVSELNRVNDILAATASGANTNIRQLGEALSYAAPFASKAGLSLEETAAAIGAMSDAGIQASRAGTGLVGILAQLADATPKAQAAIEGADLSMEQLDINARGLQPVLDDLRGANLTLGEALQIFGREAGAAALNVINASEGVAEFTEGLRDAEGAAEEMSLIIGSGLTGSMKGLSSMLSESIISLGRDDGLAAGFQSVTDTATGMLAVYNGMLPAFAEANNLTEAQTDRIEALAAGVDMLGDAAIIAAGLYTGRFVSAMAAGTLSLANKTRASIADARADAAAAAATVRRTAAEKQTALALLSTARLEAQATKGTSAHAFALQQLSVARTRAATAAGAHTAAMNVATAATARASVAARGLSTALSLVGGPLGLLVGAGGLMYMFREELGLVRSAAEPTTQRIDNLTDALNRNSVAAVEAGIVNLSAEYFTLGQRAAAATAEIERLTAAQENDRQGAQARLQNNMRLRDLREELAQVTTEQEAAGKAATQLRETLAGLGETVVPTTNSLTDLDDTTLSLTDSTTTLADAYESLLDRITPNRREARQYAQDLGTLNLALATGRMTAQQYMQAMGMLQESFQAAQRETGDLSDKVDAESDRMATLWERRLERMDDAGVDMWRSFLDGSEDAFGSFRRLALDTLAEVIHAYTTQRITASLGLNVAGGGASGGGLSFNGIGSLINGGRALLGIGSSAAAPSLAMQGGLSSAALASASQVAGGAAYSGWAGSAASGAALGNVASGGIMSSITAGVSAAMPWIAGGLAIDSLLGGGITKAISGLFGDETTPRLNISTRAGMGDYSHESVRMGGFGAVGFSEGTRRSNDLFGSVEAEREWLASVAAMDSMLAAVADTPAELDAMTAAVRGVVITAGDAATANDMLVQRTAAAASVIDGPFTDALVSAGLSAEEITQRFVAADAAMSVLVDASGRLNLQFDASADGALRASDNIAQLVGGVDNLANLQSQYYDAFFTEEEKLANLTSDLTARFAELGFELPSTRQGVRELVSGIQQMTDAGQEQYAGVLQTTPALSQYIAAMEQQRAAAEQAAQAERELAAQRSVSLGYGALVGIDGALDDYSAAVSLSETLASERKTQLQDELRAVDQLRGLVDSLMLSNQSILDPMQRLQESQRQLAELQARAESGDTAAVSQLQGASTAYLDAAAAYYGQSSSQYAAIFGDVSSSVSNLESQYGSSVDALGSIEGIERLMLREQQRARDALTRSLTEQISMADGIYNLTDLMGALPDSLARALASVFPTATTASGKTYVPGGFDQEGDALLSGARGAVADSYREIFGRDPDDSGLAYWQNRYNSGASIEEIRRSLRESAEGQERFATGAAFTNGVFDRPTAFPMGLMGEAGPEAVMPLANIGGGLGVNIAGAVDLEPLVRELQSLRQEVAQLRAERRNDASTAAGQRSQQINEQKKINMNVKLKVRTP